MLAVNFMSSFSPSLHKRKCINLFDFVYKIFKMKMIEFYIKILGSTYKNKKVNLKEIIRKIMC